MSIRMMSGIPSRFIQVLTDFLPAELDLIDAEEADGITTPDVAAFYAWDRRALDKFPAVTIRPVSSSPFVVHPDGVGDRVDGSHRIDVMFHITPKQAATPENRQALLFRYVAGAVRVIGVEKWALQTSADPVLWATVVTWAGEAVYGPEPDQEDGAIVRSATVSFDVRRIEAR